MKPQPQRNSGVHRGTGPTPSKTRFTCERGLPATSARPLPPAPRRRYPSLSDDGQGNLPRLRRAHRYADERMTVANAANTGAPSPLLSVRAFALLAIVAIVAALIAGA
jgi:hypothetical protein